MEQLKDISIEKLLEFESKNQVLSFSEFHNTMNYKKSELIALIYSLTKEKFINAKKLLYDDYNKYRKNLSTYKTIHILYNQLLDDLVLEIMDSSIEKDPLSLSILLGNYLIPLGFLSYTPIFHCTNSEKLFSRDVQYFYNDYIQGGFVFAGYGCCRHVVSFVSDFLHKLEVPNDKITCITAMRKEILSNILKDSFPNHAIMGYVMNNKYYLADILEQIYYLPIEEEYVETGLQPKIVLDYTNTHLLQPTLYWNPNLEYATAKEDVINEKKYKIAMALHLEESQRFERFKQEHFEIYQKLAYLIPLELERTTEKENEKRKRI